MIRSHASMMSRTRAASSRGIPHFPEDRVARIVLQAADGVRRGPVRGRAWPDSSQRRRYRRPREAGATCTLPATAYPALDTFGRTRRILWKDGRFARGTVTAEPNGPPLVELASRTVANRDLRSLPPLTRRGMVRPRKRP